MQRTPRLLVAVGLLGLAASGQDRISALLAQLSEGPADQAALFAIEGQRPDPRTIPALKAAFDKRTAKEEKQWIATTLLRLGERAPRYFDYLEGYAATAVDDQTPMFLKYDSDGKAISGQLDPGFENWCAQNGKDVHEVARLLASVYPADVYILAYAEDPRSTALFRRGLDSPNVFVMAQSIQGLGRLGDTSAVSLIRKACDRLRASERLAVAMQLPWLNGAEAGQLMQDIEPDPNMRDMFTRLAYQRQLAERNNALRRAGKIPADPALGK